MEKKKIAKNGIPVYSLTNENNHSFFISMFIKAGCMYENEKENGITHFLEHAAIRNVNKLMDYKLYRELDRCGMELNASTYSEMVHFFISGSERHFKTAAEIISKVLSPIVLSRSELDAERSRIKAEIREAGDKTTLAAVAAESEWQGTPLTQLIAGSLGSVSGITLSRLEAYRKRIFNKENIFFYVAGNVNNDNLSYLTYYLAINPVPLFVTPWTAAHQASLSFTITQSLLRFMSIELVMLSNHLILCHPFLLLPLIFLNIRAFSSESVLQIRWPKF